MATRIASFSQIMFLPSIYCFLVYFRGFIYPRLTYIHTGKVKGKGSISIKRNIKNYAS